MCAQIAGSARGGGPVQTALRTHLHGCPARFADGQLPALQVQKGSGQVIVAAHQAQAVVRSTPGVFQRVWSIFDGVDRTAVA